MIRVSVIGLWNSFYFPNQLEVNPKNIANTKPIVFMALAAFSRAWRLLHCIDLYMFRALIGSLG